MNYKIIQQSFKGNYTLLDYQDDLIVYVEFKRMLYQHASFQLFDNLYDLKLKSIRSSKKRIIKNGIDIGLISMNWKGHISIIFNELSGNKTYVMKQRGILKTHFELFDENKELRIEFKQTSKIFNYNYDINIFVPLSNEHEFMELLTISGYVCVLYKLYGSKM